MMGAPLSDFQEQVVEHLMMSGKSTNFASAAVLQAWSEGVGEVDASAEAIADSLLLDDDLWVDERELQSAVQVVIDDQRAGDPDMSFSDAIVHTRIVLTVDMLNTDDETYDAYVKVLTADDEDLAYAMAHIVITRARQIFGIVR